MVRKPEGVNETEQLLRGLVRVPKRELDQEVEKHKAKAKKRAAVRKKKS